MYPRKRAYWRTRFGRWVSAVTVQSIVRELGRDPDTRITSLSVYKWLNGHAPRPGRAQALVAMSGGRLSLDAVYGHRQELERLENRPAHGPGSQP